MRLSNLQILRAVAALLVAFQHALISARDYNYSSWLVDIFFNWGALGVDVFFVISGFIMVTIQHHRPKSVMEFASQRLWRIVPNYWAHTVALSIALLATPSLFNNLEFEFQHSLLSLMFLSQLATAEKPMVTVGWTLEYEMLFYSLFAISLLIRSVRIRYLALTTLLLLISLIFPGASIVLEFAFGLLIGWFYTHNQLTWNNTYALVTLTFGGCLLLGTAFIDIDVNRVVLWGIPAALVVLGTVTATEHKNKLLTFLGDASYSIYLTHWFTTPAFYKLLSVIAPTLQGTVSIVICLVSSAVSGSIVYWCFEKRIPQLRKRLLTQD